MDLTPVDSRKASSREDGLFQRLLPVHQPLSAAGSEVRCCRSNCVHPGLRMQRRFHPPGSVIWSILSLRPPEPIADVHHLCAAGKPDRLSQQASAICRLQSPSRPNGLLPTEASVAAQSRNAPKSSLRPGSDKSEECPQHDSARDDRVRSRRQSNFRRARN